jgi:16S rRNA processing protein RimM
MEVWTKAGQHLGQIEEIIATPGADVYVVKGKGREVLIPALESIIVHVDVSMRRMTIEALEGLL